MIFRTPLNLFTLSQRRLHALEFVAALREPTLEQHR
jgi:hypothetical protein